MNFISPIRGSTRLSTPFPDLDARIASATDALLAARDADGHWCFELEADATIPSEYVLLVHYLGEKADPVLEAKIGNYLRRIQAEHGGWPLYHGGDLDLSASVKAYFALKMIGDDVEAAHMRRAREAILARGGAREVNVFTRFQLALYGQVGWDQVPTMPVELMLAPRWFPVHLSKMSYWARTVIAPMLVIQVLKPQARNKRRIGIAELFVSVDTPRPPKPPSHAHPAWATFFNGLDAVLKKANRAWPKKLRQRAMREAVAFTTERLNGEDGLGAIYPAIANSVMMYDALGYPENHLDRAIARRAIDKLLVVKEHEAYCQPCVSPIWDTALASHALMETGDPAAEEIAEAAIDWLRPRQILDTVGDWAERRPGLRPGGWAFQYGNDHYPDTDDTAVVLMAMDRLRRAAGSDGRNGDAVARGREWIEGMQSRNGGWGAFDVDNTYYYLNNIPFSDHGALLDPPTVDVSARCVGMLAQLGEAPDSQRIKAAVQYILDDQEPDGSWFGRWGVNYIYGTWSALCALNAAGMDTSSPAIRKAADWLIAIQNPDGGWGEDCRSYKLDYRHFEPAASRASQTAWALLGLMAVGETDHPAVERGIAYLASTQGESGFWPEEDYTGGGFPRVFYLRYHGYAKYFPLWALARYRNLKRSNSGRVAWGL